MKDPVTFSTWLQKTTAFMRRMDAAIENGFRRLLDHIEKVYGS